MEFNLSIDITVNIKNTQLKTIIKSFGGILSLLLTEFINNILETYGRSNDNQDYNALSINSNGFNCNNYSTSLIEGAGGKLPNGWSPKKLDPGTGESIPHMLDSNNNNTNINWQQEFKTEITQSIQKRAAFKKVMKNITKTFTKKQ